MARLCDYCLWILLLVTYFCCAQCTVTYDCSEHNFCDRVKCDAIDDCSSGIIVDGGGVCGCCQVCLAFLEFGATCNPDNILPDDLRTAIPLSDTSRTVVVPICSPKWTCNAKVGCTYQYINESISYYDDLPESCFTLHDYYEMAMEDSAQSKLWAWEPQCDAVGNYIATQCKGDVDERRCYCVDEVGNTIFGQDFGKDGEMACGSYATY